MALFGDWLRDQRDLQVIKYQTDPQALEGSHYAEYLRVHALAASVELAEYLQERDWKPYKAEGRRLNNRAAAVEELVDVLHHVGNLLLLEGVTDEELNAAYRAKLSSNYTRTDHHG